MKSVTKSFAFIVLALVFVPTVMAGAGHADHVKNSSNGKDEVGKSKGNPVKWWCPGEDRYFTKYIIKVVPGESSEDLMSIESQTDLEDVEVWITPEIDPYLSFQGQTAFEELEAGDKQDITGEVEVPSEVEVGTTYDGTVHIKSTESQRTYPKVLKINIEVVSEDDLPEDHLLQWKRVN